ncbi:MAG: zinc ribbon domain-containing protein [Clostridium sp.]
MFCVNCGSQVQDGATFCTSCGAKLNGGGSPSGGGRPIFSNETQVLATNGGVEALEIIKNPIGTISRLKEKSDSAYLVVGAITVILSILSTIILVAVMKNAIGGMFSFSMMGAFGAGTFKMICFTVISDLCIMAGVAGVTFGALKTGYTDSEVTYFSGLKVSVAAYFYMKVIMAVGILICFVSGMIGGILILLSVLAYSILIYCGIKEYGEYRGSSAFYMTMLSIVAMMVINYILMKVIS